MANLLIVESPAKAKTISSFLGGNWIVKASVGHFRDLPRHEMGVEAPDYKPKYEISEDKKAIVSSLKKLAESANEIFLGTDDDREGEAIAWHLKEVLRLKNPHRIIFHDVNKPTLEAALAKPRQINMPLVHAQEGRRVSDRLVGYILSPLVQRASGIQNLSVGRVQSIALRLVVEREREIGSFVSTPFYEVEITLQNGLKMSLVNKSIRPDLDRLTDEAMAKVIAMCSSINILSVETKPRQVLPPAAFTTSTMQQTANAQLKMSLKSCMAAAQGLHDKGLITYHRTDDPNMSDGGYEKLCTWMKTAGLEARRGKRIWKSKASAQEAHEAIRPYDFAVDSIDGTDDEKKLYTLIRDRAIRSQMPDCEESVTTITAEDTRELENDHGKAFKARFVTTGRVEVSAGWRAYKRQDIENDKDEEGGQIINVSVAAGQGHELEHAQVLTKATVPPKRYTEGSLVKKLESLAIGRPATYASIVSTIITHGYVTVGDPNDKKKPATAFVPTKIGSKLIDALSEHRFLDYAFTSRIEQQLDDIAENRLQYRPMIRDMHDFIMSDLSMLKLDALNDLAKENGGECPVCKKAVIKRKNGKTGDFFWIHLHESADCHKYLADSEGMPVVRLAGTVSVACPVCSKPVKRLESRDKKGAFYWVHNNREDAEGCEKYLDDVNGKPMKKTASARPEATCPACGEVVRRFPSKTSSGFYWSHVNDPVNCSKFLPDKDGKPALKNIVK